MNPETIRAFTPIAIAAIGGLMGVAVLISPNIPSEKWTAGMGLAGTAIAGAAGLAQSTESKSKISVEEEGKKIQAGTEKASN